MKAAGATLLIALALGACRALPEIPALTCGNGVLEAGEDCDAYGHEQAGCRPAGQSGACHFDCAKTANSAVGTCPMGFGCDASGVCRRAHGAYSDSEITVPGAAVSLLAGDFDGNGRSDVLSLQAKGALGLARPGITFFDRNGVPEGSFAMTKLVASPAVAEVSGDRRADLVSSTFASLSVLLGQADRSLITAIFPSFYLKDTQVRLLSVTDTPVEHSSPIVILADFAGAHGLNVSGIADPTLRGIAELPDGIDALAGKPALANIDEDDEEAPCLDLALGYRAATEVRVYQACRYVDGALVWRSEARVTPARFDPPSSLVGAPLLADIDGDGHVDLFALSADGPYVAFGDGHSLGALTPYALRYVAEQDGLDAPAPLSAGDITGDGAADFVDRRALLLSVKQPDGTIAYERSQSAVAAPWKEAEFADFSGDGQLDAVAVGDGVPDIEFFMSTGTRRPNPFVIQTPRPPTELTVGDFDGDTLPDLAYVEAARDGSEVDGLSVSFGAPQGPLGVRTPVAELANIEQLTSTIEHTQNTVADLLITHHFEVATGSDSGVSLIAGSGDRGLFSPFLFNSYSSTGSLENANTIALALGGFTDPTAAQVVAFALPDDTTTASMPYSVWLMPDLRNVSSAPERLSWELDPRFAPISTEGESPLLLARLVAGDLDADAHDELVVAGPLPGSAVCLIQTGRIDREQARLLIDQQLELAAGCEPEPSLAVEDIDADGARDLVLIAGTGDARRLLLLRNDGSGGFRADNATPVLSDAAVPQAFMLFRSAPAAALRLAVVMAGELRVLEWSPKNRAFRELPAGRGLLNGTGVVAADVDGDGVKDLVVADGGSLRVLRAALEGL